MALPLPEYRSRKDPDFHVTELQTVLSPDDPAYHAFEYGEGEEGMPAKISPVSRSVNFLNSGGF
jgi:hypothetical protein